MNRIKQYITADRLTGLSDAVFAIVLTLLVLDLKLKTPSNFNDLQLWRHLIDMYPLFIAYILTFLIVAKYWQLHAIIFDKKQDMNAYILWLNIIFLLLISFLPLPSGLLGTNYTQLSIIMFNVSIATPSFCLFLIAKSLFNAENKETSTDNTKDNTKFSKNFIYSLLIIPVAAIISIIIALINVHFALAGWFLLVCKNIFFTKE